MCTILFILSLFPFLQIPHKINISEQNVTNDNQKQIKPTDTTKIKREYEQNKLEKALRKKKNKAKQNDQQKIACRPANFSVNMQSVFFIFSTSLFLNSFFFVVICICCLAASYGNEQILFL